MTLKMSGGMSKMTKLIQFPNGEQEYVDVAKFNKLVELGVKFNVIQSKVGA